MPGSRPPGRPALLAALVLLLALLLVAPAQAQTIAVLDTGVDADHPQFEGRVTRNSFVDYGRLPELPGLPPLDPGGIEDDPDGHGTAAASVAAGRDTGTAPSAGILDLQVDARYTGFADPAAEEAATRAFDWLLQQEDPPRVVLVGFASGGVSPEGARTLAAQARSLHEAGVAVVVPAAATYSSLHTSPAVFTVAADAPCAGDIHSPAAKPDAAARADGIEAAVPGTAAEPGGTERQSGTHLAAAQAAGALARMFEARAGLPVDAAYALLRSTAQDAGPEGPDSCTGFGTLDVEAAVAGAQAWEDPFTEAPGPGDDTPLPWPLALLAVALALVRRRRA